MTIEFKTYGKDLRYRHPAMVIREQMKRAWSTTEKFVFDFAEVETIGMSFADECFAKLLLDFEMEEIKEKSTFQNAPHSIKQVIANAFSKRLSEMAEEKNEPPYQPFMFSDFTGE